MANAKCADCDKVGRLGNDIRTYQISSPLAEFELQLCFSCYLKHEKKNVKRTHIHIRDKVQI